jgi:hypothetical protein
MYLTSAYHGIAIEVHLAPCCDVASVMSKIAVAASALVYWELEGCRGQWKKEGSF